MSYITLPIASLKHLAGRGSFLNYLSDDGQFIVWFHDGRCGTQGHISPAGRFTAVFVGVTPGGEHFSVGKLAEPAKAGATT